MPPSRRTFRIFVSSTFSDLKEERNALQVHVFPRLRQLCEAHGCRFQAIDLRWGVSEEAGLDQRTLKICLNEILRCRRTSPRPNFIVLLGDRYGWRPLPTDIPRSEFESIEKHVASAPDLELLEHWYKLDLNAVPPVYCLQPRVTVSGDQPVDDMERARLTEALSWQKTEANLRRILHVASAKLKIPEKQKLKYSASATEHEILEGVISISDPSHVFCFIRTIQSLPAGEIAKDFLDLDSGGNPDKEAIASLQFLKKQIRKLIPKNTFEYSSRWLGSTITTNHLSRLCEDCYRCLSEIISMEIEQLQEMDVLDQEISAHENFGRERSKFFTGRMDLLNKVVHYLEGANRGRDPSLFARLFKKQSHSQPAQEQKESNRPLILVGVSGSGKTALMGRCGEEARRSFPYAAILMRFLGATPSSSRSRNLLEGLCLQISNIYGAKKTELPTGLKELSKEFSECLKLATKARPLILFIDALDQLAAADRGRNLSWLPSELPPHVFLIVSTLPGEILKSLEKRLQQNFVEVESMSGEDAVQLLDTWLTDAGRTLQPAQRDLVLSSFQKCGLPLYLKLAFEKARQWRSYDVIPDIATNIPAIIQSLLKELSMESNHGSMLVSRSLGYLASARHGLSEDEMIDILSCDDELFAHFREHAHHELPATTSTRQRLPVVLWSRLYFDLEPYLSEYSADGTSLLGFYHRQFQQVVRELFLSPEFKTPRHKHLAGYFGENRQSPNLRTLSELPFQQTEAEEFQSAFETLTSFSFVEAKCSTDPQSIQSSGMIRHDGVFLVIEDYISLIKKIDDSISGDKHHLRPSLELVKSLLLSEADNCSRWPGIARQQIFNALGEFVESQDVLSIEKKLRESLAGKFWIQQEKQRYRPRLQLRLSLVPGQKLRRARFRPGSTMIVVATHDSWMLWDVRTGKTLVDVSLEQSIITSLEINRNGTLLALSHSNGECSVWSLPDGNLVQRWNAHRTRCDCVAFSEDSRTMATSGIDEQMQIENHVRIWNRSNLQQIEESSVVLEEFGARLRGSDSGVIVMSDYTLTKLNRSVGLRFLNSEVLAICTHSVLRFWNYQANKVIWETHESIRSLQSVDFSQMQSMAVSADAQLIAIGTDNGVRFWRIRNGVPGSNHATEGSGLFMDLSISSENSLIAGVTERNRCYFWNVLTGKTQGELKAIRPASVDMSDNLILIGAETSCDIYKRTDVESWKEELSSREETFTAAFGKGKAVLSLYGTLLARDLRSGKQLWQKKVSSAAIRSMDISVGGEIACGGDDYYCTIWDANAEKMLSRFTSSAGKVSCVRFFHHSDSVWIGTQEGSCFLWNWRNNQTLHEQRPFQEAVRASDISANDQLVIVAGDDSDCVLFDIQKGLEQKRLKGHTAWCKDAAFSPVSPNVVATGGHDNTVRLWDISKDIPPHILKHSATIQTICFDANGDLLISVDQDSICTLWSVSDRTIAGIYPLEGRILSAGFISDQIAIVNEASELTVLTIHKGVQNGVHI